mmetsp:Transcript_25046/g.57673  ORF Transcript_25046/g.57673 Transcript_25046/m.57673 type:complete len:204 (-) Transcript_25046:69-680(-)
MASRCWAFLQASSSVRTDGWAARAALAASFHFFSLASSFASRAASTAGSTELEPEASALDAALLEEELAAEASSEAPIGATTASETGFSEFSLEATAGAATESFSVLAERDCAAFGSCSCGEGASGVSSSTSSRASALTTAAFIRWWLMECEADTSGAGELPTSPPRSTNVTPTTSRTGTANSNRIERLVLTEPAASSSPKVP